MKEYDALISTPLLSFSDEKSTDASAMVRLQDPHDIDPVSYTRVDVYKRQGLEPARKNTPGRGGGAVTTYALVMVLGSAVVHAGWNLATKKAEGGTAYVFLMAAGSALIWFPLFLWLDVYKRQPLRLQSTHTLSIVLRQLTE